MNASPDSVGLDFLLDDEVKAANVAYLGSGAMFHSISQGERDLRLRGNGTVEELTNEAFIFALDRHYLSVAVGLVNFGTEPLKRLRSLTFQVDRTIPNGNKARLYVIHAYHRSTGFDTPAIDFQTPGDNPLYELPDIAFGSQRSIVVDSGSTTFEARRTGTENVLASATLTLDPGKIYVVVVGGIEGGAGAQAPQLALIEIQPE